MIRNSTRHIDPILLAVSYVRPSITSIERNALEIGVTFLCDCHSVTQSAEFLVLREWLANNMDRYPKLTPLVMRPSGVPTRGF